MLRLEEWTLLMLVTWFKTVIITHAFQKPLKMYINFLSDTFPIQMA